MNWTACGERTVAGFGHPSPLEGRAGGSAIVTQTALDEWVFGDEYGARLLRDHFRVATVAGYGLEATLRRGCGGRHSHYVRETQRGSLTHLDGIRFYQQQDSLLLDPATLRNLELIDPPLANRARRRCWACSTSAPPRSAHAS